MPVTKTAEQVVSQHQGVIPSIPGFPETYGALGHLDSLSDGRELRVTSQTSYSTDCRTGKNIAVLNGS